MDRNASDFKGKTMMRPTDSLARFVDLRVFKINVILKFWEMMRLNVRQESRFCKLSIIIVKLSMTSHYPVPRSRGERSENGM